MNRSETRGFPPRVLARLCWVNTVPLHNGKFIFHSVWAEVYCKEIGSSGRLGIEEFQEGSHSLALAFKDMLRVMSTFSFHQAKS